MRGAETEQQNISQGESIYLPQRAKKKKRKSSLIQRLPDPSTPFWDFNV
tara:strand:+ start:1019 stop:1165 length:147 start_codon:yes stop_codon:yes gene_type:complete